MHGCMEEIHTPSVVQVLLLPCGGGDSAVGVHDDLGTADNHGHQQQAEEGDASQSQTLVHVHKGWLRSAFHLHDCCLLLSSATPTHPAIILKTQLEIHREGRKTDMLSHVEDKGMRADWDQSHDIITTAITKC